MGFLKVFELDFLNLRKRDNVKKGISSAAIDERDELQSLLNNIKDDKPLTDSTEKTANVARFKDPEVQKAITKFNSLSVDKKQELLDVADKKLQDKLMNFMNKNASVAGNTEMIKASFRGLTEDIAELISKKDYNKDKISALAEKYENIRKKCMENVDKSINAFAEFKGIEDLENLNEPISTNSGYVINISNRFRQTVLSYSSRFDSLVIELAKTNDESQCIKLLQDIKTIVKNVELDFDRYYDDSSEALNSFIPEVVSSKNQFYAIVSKYLNSEIPHNFRLESKECENAFIDTLLENLNYTGANLYQ